MLDQAQIIKFTPHPEAFTDEELLSLAARASTFDERRSGGALPIAAEQPSASADASFNAWCLSASGGDKVMLDKVCAHLELTLDEAKSAFGDVALAPTQLPPGWIDTFAWLFPALQAEPGPLSSYTAGREPQLPYEPLFYPLITAVRNRRDAQADARWLSLFQEQALCDLDRALLKLLTDVCVRALNDKFALTNHAVERSLGPLAFASIRASTSREEQIASFITNLRKEGLKAFFWDRPVLARLLSTIVEQWQSATLEFMERLYRDLTTEIADISKMAASGQVIRIGTGLSDLHNGGRSVYKVTFESGRRIGYKPKSLSIDLAWANLLGWLEKNGAPASAGTPATRACNGYGWVEWLATENCSSRAEARRFFHRSGATLCLIRMLQGNDFHFENVIACGSVPVPVDLETIMVARPKDVPANNDTEQAMLDAFARLDGSVFSTGYLPSWMGVPGGAAVLMGGLDVHEMPASLRTAANEKETDETTSARAAGVSNVPSLDGKPLQVRDFKSELIAGYEEMFNFLSLHGADIAAPGGPLDSFENLKFRPVLRPTRIYALLQQRALGRKSVCDGAAWSQNFFFFYRSSLTRDAVPPIAQVCAYERAAMSEFNIPFFEAHTTSKDLICGDGTVVRDYFRAPCLDEVRKRLRTLQQDVLHRDRLMIEQALQTTVADAGNCEPQSTATDIPAASREQLLETALGLADSIEQASIRAGKGATWLGLAPISSDERKLQLQALGPSLYSGTIGIALFYAGLYRATGDNLHRVRSLSTIASIVDIARDDPHKLEASIRISPLGLDRGVGGQIYGLVWLATLLGEQQLLDTAGVYAQLLTKERIENSKEYGLFSGVAGVLIALLALSRQDGAVAVEDHIQACAKLLLARRSTTMFGGQAWRGQTWALPQTGLMHGASGIALALGRAGVALDECQYQKAARQGLDYERGLLEHCGGWPDLRDATSKETLSNAQCGWDYANGAAGIGMARLELAKINGFSDGCAADVEQAVQTVRSAPTMPVDELFGGNVGRASFLMEAARATKDDALRRDAAIQIADILSTVDKNGGFRWRAGEDRDNPCFFNGAAGIGWALLRLAHPEKVPNVLGMADNDDSRADRSEAWLQGKVQ